MSAASRTRARSAADAEATRRERRPPRIRAGAAVGRVRAAVVATARR
ncbi:MAG: hypothetical protein JWP66_1502, partial [Naasia sp.]|nr:hypothetical protein [Naasia sp.]